MTTTIDTDTRVTYSTPDIVDVGEQAAYDADCARARVLQGVQGVEFAVRGRCEVRIVGAPLDSPRVFRQGDAIRLADVYDDAAVMARLVAASVVSQVDPASEMPRWNGGAPTHEVLVSIFGKDGAVLEPGTLITQSSSLEPGGPGTASMVTRGLLRELG